VAFSFLKFLFVNSVFGFHALDHQAGLCSVCQRGCRPLSSRLLLKCSTTLRWEKYTTYCQTTFYLSGNRRYCSYSAGDYEVCRPQGLHYSRISVNFGTAEWTFGRKVPSTVPNFTLIREYWGFPAQKMKQCQNCHFSPRRDEPQPQHLTRCWWNP